MQTDKPLTMFHGNSRIFGIPNSIESFRAALTHPVDIIEIDIRKSKDGVLFCYHGCMFAWALKYLPYQIIGKVITVNTLEEVCALVNGHKILFLDIKDKTVIADDLKHIIGTFRQSEFWIAAYSLKYLNRLKSALPQFKYIYNFGFVFFNHGLKIAKKLNIDVIKLFRWQYNDRNIQKLKDIGIEFALHTLFLSPKKFEELVNKNGSLWVVKNDWE